jgi:molecular chaperone GrpE (heat shock protein)
LQNKDIESLKQELEQLRRAVHEQSNSAEHSLAKLRQEVRSMKKGLLDEAETPLLRDLFLFYDSLSWYQQNLVQQEMSAEILAEHYQHLVDEFLEVLYRRNVVPQNRPTLFNKLKHHAVQVVKAEQPHHDFRVVEVLKLGFERNGETLRPSQVIVARFTQD